MPPRDGPERHRLGMMRLAVNGDPVHDMHPPRRPLELTSLLSSRPRLETRDTPASAGPRSSPFLVPSVLRSRYARLLRQGSPLPPCASARAPQSPGHAFPHRPTHP